VCGVPTASTTEEPALPGSVPGCGQWTQESRGLWLSSVRLTKGQPPALYMLLPAVSYISQEAFRHLFSLCAELCHHVLSLKVYPDSSAIERYHGFHIGVASQREPIAYRLQWIKPCFSKPTCICRATHAITRAQGENTRLIRIACPTSDTFSFLPKTKKKSLVQWSGCITYRKPSICRSTALLLAPPKCSQIFTNPPEGVCKDPFHRRPFTQTLLEDFHLWQRIAPSPRV